MTPEQEQTRRLFEAALELGPSERTAFLEESCGGNKDLLHALYELIAQHDRTGGAALHWKVGQTISHYVVVEKLGAGGMGVVYKCQDMRLGRIVALKCLPEGFTTDAAALGRFRQEARAASVLNHPNICTLYDIGEAEGTHFITMEYVEGASLNVVLSSRRLHVSETLDIAIQAADALTEAHARGIIHRDIKPANIIVTPRGQVKVIDFGLAKLTRVEVDPSLSDATSNVLTQPGTVMGTVFYMSPEQALGREVDHRTDIFSLGGVLYEMATGRPPFRGTTATETMDQILHSDPEPITSQSHGTELEAIILKCLEKQPERRYQSRELVRDLRSLKQPSRRTLWRQVGAACRRYKWVMLGLATACMTIVAVIAAVSNFRQSKPMASDSIAILPFDTPPGDSEIEYLAEGISEALMNDLSNIPGLRVIARGSVTRYKGRDPNPLKAGSELGIRVVVSGRIARAGDRLRIQAGMADVASGARLWGEQYIRNKSEILAIQSDLTQQVARRLTVKLSDERELAKGTTHPEVYELYLRARHAYSKQNISALYNCTEYAEKAINLDPSYGPAHAVLASCYVELAGSELSPHEAIRKGRAAAEAALELDDRIAEAHVALGKIRLEYDRDWIGSAAEFRRAIALNPNASEARIHYGFLLVYLGRFDEGLTESYNAVKTDPLSVFVEIGITQQLYLARRFDESIARARKIIELSPNYFYGPLALGNAYVEKRAFKEAIPALEKAYALEPHTIIALGYAQARAGNRVAALEIIEKLRRRTKYVPPYNVASIYAALGDKDQAFDWLYKAEQERDEMIVQMKVDPWMDPLRPDPRFPELLRRLGMPD